MREIKFRAWDEDDEVMFYSKGHNFCFVEADRPDKEHGVIMQGSLNCLVDQKMPLMQYTGLKDKNGKEIYEGDVVNITLRGDDDPEACIVEDLRYLPMMDKERYGDIVQKVEIIGNIYENAGLING